MVSCMNYSKTILLSFSFSAALFTGAWAQAPGQTRIQGVPLPDGSGAVLGQPGLSPLMDFREQMRLFVQSISAYARQTKPNFVIIAKNGLDLMVKRDDTDETKTSPARTYLRSLDGIMVEGLFNAEAKGDRPFGTPPPAEIQTKMMGMAKFAKSNGLKVLALDFGKGKDVIDEVRKKAEEHDFISLVSDVPSADIHQLPTYPSRPPHEDPNSILSLDMVHNYVTIRNSSPFGNQDQFALKMHDTNYDAVIVEVFHGRKPLSRQAVETLKYKKVGSKRLVFAYMDIGSAASYRYYWQPNWREGSPFWMSAPMRDDPDRYNVEYWQADWQNIISGNTNSYLYGIIAQGFDGVVIDGLEAYKFFDGSLENGEEGF